MRHFGLAHGIGRSGDLTESQPKAFGSTLLYRLSTFLLLDAIRRGSGLTQPVSEFGLVVPMCTGMSMALILSSLRGHGNCNKKDGCVLWCRIDQKSCFKSILSSGLRVVVIPTKLQDDAIVTDLGVLQQTVDKEMDNIVAIISTTSCFAPRIPDPVDLIAKIAKAANVPHVINHAYGLQCAITNKLLVRASIIGRVDAVVCSTDKNFMVPVGGGIILSPSNYVIQKISKIYAGRASASPIIDLFITLMSMGLNGYTSLLAQRNALIPCFRKNFETIASKFGERLLSCPTNTISFAITLDQTLSQYIPKHLTETSFQYQTRLNKEITYLGSMLFTRCVSGTRVVSRNSVKVVNDVEFQGFGSSHDDYPYAYLTAACAIGLDKDEMLEFFKRVEKTMVEFSKKMQKKYSGQVVTELEELTNYSSAEDYHQQYLEKGGRFGRPQSAKKGCNDPIRCYG